MKIALYIVMLILMGCATNSKTVYQQLGGLPKVEEVVDNFITEIEYDAVIFAYFKDSNIDRFREKMIEHLCLLIDGPCEYTGDTMEQVHTGMNISESDFNRGVDLFINAMVKAEVPYAVQNKILAAMAPTREQMIYR